MKKITTVLMVFGLLVLSSSAAAAQSYEGTSLEEGIFYVPADAGPGSVINFAASGLVPNSDVRITVLNADQTEVSGVQVEGAIVVRSDAGGNINVDIRLPANVAAGTVTLRVEATRADDTALLSELAIDVSPADVQNPGGTDGPPSALAFSGSESSNKVLGGVLLVVAGLALVVVASQRRSVPSDA